MQLVLEVISDPRRRLGGASRCLFLPVLPKK